MIVPVDVVMLRKELDRCRSSGGTEVVKLVRCQLMLGLNATLIGVGFGHDVHENRTFDLYRDPSRLASLCRIAKSCKYL